MLERVITGRTNRGCSNTVVYHHVLPSCLFLSFCFPLVNKYISLSFPLFFPLFDKMKNYRLSAVNNRKRTRRLVSHIHSLFKLHVARPACEYTCIYIHKLEKLDMLEEFAFLGKIGFILDEWICKWYSDILKRVIKCQRMRFLKGEFIIRSKSRPSMYGHVVYVTSDTVLISGTRPLGHSASGRCGGHFARTLCESKTINIHDKTVLITLWTTP